MSLMEAREAVDYFRRALQIAPSNAKLKMAFAEATMKSDEYDKIQVKGKKQRLAAYEVVGIRDVLLDREKIPAFFYGKYQQVLDIVDIPEDAVMPIEALDGSIGHSKIVALLSFAIATELGVPEKKKISILNAAYVADIGKESVPHHLLNHSKGGMGAAEFAEVQKHAVEGSNILKNMGHGSEQMLRIVRHSHERLDGSGYPDGLKGTEEIPLGSRIVAVADAYDSMTSWRPYRERLDRGVALDELRRGAGIMSRALWMF